MDSKVESTTGGLRIHTDSGINGIDDSTPKKTLRSSSSRSSSSSPDSPFDDPFSNYELDESITDTTPAKLKKDTQLKKFKCGDDNASINSVTKADAPQLSLHNASPANAKPPLTQAMERPVGSPYRIPSYVFARTKSTAPMEWSVASNESLFSIHMGDTSFGRDSMFNYSYNQPTMNLSNATGKPSESYLAEPPIETMKEVVKESAEEKGKEKLYLSPCVSCRSDVSGASSQSFAFPILTGNAGKDGSTKTMGSVRISWGLQSQQLTPKTPQPHPLVQEPPPQPKALLTTHTKWFGCFTCCTCCSC